MFEWLMQLRETCYSTSPEFITKNVTLGRPEGRDAWEGVGEGHGASAPSAGTTVPRPRVTNPEALSLDLRFPGSFDTEADAPSRRAGVAH